MPIVAGVYSGLRYIRYPMTAQGATDLQNDINSFTEDRESESIVSISLLPSELVPTISEGEANVKNVSKSLPIKGYFYDPLNDPNATEPYIPKNAKMFTSPYMFVLVDGQEDKTNYKIEKMNYSVRMTWNDIWEASLSNGTPVNFGNVNFTASAGVSPTPDIVIRPTSNYDNADGRMNAFVIKGFPQLPYVIDSYRAYVASQGGELGLGLKTMFSMLGGAGQISSGLAGVQAGEATVLSGAKWERAPYGNKAVVGGINSIINGVANISNTLTDLYVNTHKGDSARGNTNYSVGMIGTRSKNIYIIQMAVNLSDAIKIDNFFSVYGYSINQIDFPNIYFNTRPRWNYVKTKQCNVTGDMPNEAIDKLKNIMNNGITLWHGINNFLHYELNNRPVTT